MSTETQSSRLGMSRSDHVIGNQSRSQKSCIYYYTIDTANKKQKLKEYNKFTQAIQAEAPKQQTLADTFKRKEKYPQDSDMAKNITEKVLKLIIMDNQLIRGRGSGLSSSPGAFESLVCPIISALHYFDSTFDLQRAGVHSSLVALIQQSM